LPARPISDACHGDIACQRLKKAIDFDEKILIYGDYDVDGTTAVSLMILFLKRFTTNITYYIPDRYNEGYGVSNAGIAYAAKNNFTLVITLDCGIKAHEQIASAQLQGIDVIVCDHHNQGSELPKAHAILNPKRTDCTYPFKELSGCGVGFKFLQAFCSVQSIPIEEVYSLLDLVAVSIASDIVPMIGENRILAHYGLIKINTNPLLGIQAIKKIAGIEQKKVIVSDLVFKIGPRINAAGRIDSGSLAVELLTVDDADKAESLASQINSFNETRKDLDKTITAEAIVQIEQDAENLSKKTNVVYHESWHKGVVGIVASRIIEKHYKPTVVLTKSNDKITGSARSVDGFDLYSALEKCAHLLTNFGGHCYAAGLSMKEENLPLFKQQFEQAVNETILPEMLTPNIAVDTEIDLATITPKFYRILKQFEPFGPRNMAPIFLAKEVTENGSLRTMGGDNSHLKMHLKTKHNTSASFEAVAFGRGADAEQLKLNDLDVCFTIEENSFRGETRLQLNIRDVRISSGDLEG